MTIITPLKTTFISLIALLVFSSCSKKDNPADIIYVIRGTAEAQVSGNPVSSNGYGNITGGYSITNNKLAFNVNWVNLGSAPTGTSFYLEGSVAQGNAAIVFPVTEGSKSTGLTAGEMSLTEEQASSLLNGSWYYTINTVDHPNGELKGRVQVNKE